MTRSGLRILAFRLAEAIVPRVPETMGRVLAILAAEVAYRTLGGVRRRVAANLAPALGPAASPARLDWAVRGVFRTVALNYFELFRLPTLDARALAARVSIHHVERLSDALRRGAGVVVVTAHLGPFDAVTQLAVLLRLPVMIPVEPIEPPVLRELVTRLRASQGVRVVPLGTAAVREAVRTLRSGGIVTLALDRDVLGDGQPLPFFGREATFQEGPVMLAARTGAVILPIFALREGLDRSTVLIEEPVPLVYDDRGAVDTQATLRAVVAVLERVIAAHPDQWLVFAPVWRGAAAQRESAAAGPYSGVHVGR